MYARRQIECYRSVKLKNIPSRIFRIHVMYLTYGRPEQTLKSGIVWYERCRFMQVKLQFKRGSPTCCPLNMSPFYLGGITIASPLVTTTPSWFVQIVSILTLFFSGIISTTLPVAVIVSPMRTGARKFRVWLK